MSSRRRYGVAGHPVAHSLSPRMHNAAYANLGLDADYQLLPVPPELFDETVRALPGSGFSGINVTIPHKQAALAVADKASQAARAIGAANTLSFVDGAIAADNTDAPGLIDALPAGPSGHLALVIGAGGTARAAIYALKNAGAEVFVWNRTAQKAAALADEFGATAVAEPSEVAGRAGFIVNTTAAGMEQQSASVVQEQLHLDIAELAPDAVLVDYVYSAAGSPLTTAARDAGIRVVDGLELLVSQGARSFELWFDRPAPRDAMRNAII